MPCLAPGRRRRCRPVYDHYTTSWCCVSVFLCDHRSHDHHPLDPSSTTRSTTVAPSVQGLAIRRDVVAISWHPADYDPGGIDIDHPGCTHPTDPDDGSILVDSVDFSPPPYSITGPDTFAVVVWLARSGRGDDGTVPVFGELREEDGEGEAAYYGCRRDTEYSLL